MNHQWPNTDKKNPLQPAWVWRGDCLADCVQSQFLCLGPFQKSFSFLLGGIAVIEALIVAAAIILADCQRQYRVVRVAGLSEEADPVESLSYTSDI